MSLALLSTAPALSFNTAAEKAAKTGLSNTVKTRSIDSSKRTLGKSSELLVFLAPGVNPAGFAKRQGMSLKYTLKSDMNMAVYDVGSAALANTRKTSLTFDSEVRGVYVNERTQNLRMAFVPDDPYFHHDTPSSGWPGQWHLLNEYVSGRDARVQGAWNRDITGEGVTIGVVDDCLERTHPDLSPNYVAADSWDFGGNDPDPSPVYSDDQHGVSTSGVAAARGGNGIGVTGAAPYAGLAGLRIDFNTQTSAMFASATLYHSSGSNTNIKVKNHSYGVNVPYVPAAAEEAALVASAAAGTIHAIAAGNQRGASYVNPDAGKGSLIHIPEVITVAALGSNGKFSYYSCYGANVFVTAPSSSSAGLYGITTTDRTTEALGYNGSGDTFPDSNYTSRFGGTSSATPLVAGVMALCKQAQPNLNVRFAKHLMVLTSDVVDPSDITVESDGGWKTNGAGNKFNQNYGFGLIDADELTQAAVQYSGVTALTTYSTGNISVGATIPDNNATGVTRTFDVTATTPLEEVLVTLNFTHAYDGDITASITSPSGLTSRLMKENLYSIGTGTIAWSFCTNAFWGENPAGTWTLKVRDAIAFDTGTWNSYSATLRMGSLIGDQQPTPPDITRDPLSQTVIVGQTAIFSSAVTGNPTPTVQWQKLSDSVWTDIPGATSLSYRTPPTIMSDSESQFRCIATNSAGSHTSEPATLTVLPLPKRAIGIRISDLKNTPLPENPIRVWGKVTSASPVKISDGLKEIKVIGLTALVDDYVVVTGDWSDGALTVNGPVDLYFGSLRIPMSWIPAGSFDMGTPESYTESHNDNEHPQHSVSLSAYCISKNEITRGQYRQFIIDGGYTNSSYWSIVGWSWKESNNLTEPSNWNESANWGSPPGTFIQSEDHPVVGVSYYEAEAFCNWAGGHLPTEAQWERAASWTGSYANIYPWGDTWDVQKCNNLDDTIFLGFQTSPVGSYSGYPSPSGCQDMAGNVWEWCSDWHGSDYYATSPPNDPQGPASGSYRVLRGGGWNTNDSSSRCANRGFTIPDIYGNNYGFRLAR